MASPYLTVKLNANARSFALHNSSPEGFDERLNVGERNGCGGRFRKDSSEGLAVLGVHRRMISHCDSNRNQSLAEIADK